MLAKSYIVGYMIGFSIEIERKNKNETWIEKTMKKCYKVSWLN